MTLEQEILEAVRALPADKQQPRKPRGNGRGLWADLNIDLSAEVIDEARREMWNTFRQG
jgi:hypothetical protein